MNNAKLSMREEVGLATKLSRSSGKLSKWMVRISMSITTSKETGTIKFQ